MADSSPLGRSINLGSDQVPEHYCQPCFDVNSAIKPVAGYCVDCQESLCCECYTSHLLPKPLRNHRLVDKSTRPKSKQQPQQQNLDKQEKCPRHHGECLQSFCKSHSQLCCKVCLTINHKACHTEDISKMARYIKSSGELKNLNKKISMLKKSFNEYLSKTETNRSTIQTNYIDAIKEMKKLRDDFERLMTETEHHVELVKVEDLKKVESVTDTCNVVIDEINKMASNLEKLQNKGDDERIFISIKRAESELQSMDESLTKLRSDNIVREYKFEPDVKLKALLGELKVLGRLSCLPSTHTKESAAKAISIKQQMVKKPTHVKDITVSDKNLRNHGSVAVPNKQILITDFNNKKVKLIDTNNGSFVSQIQLSDTPWDLTKVNTDQFAVTLPEQNKIQILSLKQNILSIDRDINVNGKCYGIAYNDKDQTFIVSYCYPGKVENINMTGTVVRIIATDSNGSKLFGNNLHYVALSPDMTGIYVSDCDNDSVTYLSINGDVKAMYKDNGLKYPAGICVHKSGLIYVVGYISNTVHEIDPGSGVFKLLLNQKDGLNLPWSISYYDVEDKMYVGMFTEKHLKEFEMK